MFLGRSILILPSGHAEAVAGLVGKPARVIFWRVGRCQATEQGEEEEGRGHNDGKLAKDGLTSAELGPLACAISNVVLELLEAELVVDHATKSDGVAEELQSRDLGAPDHHRGNNEQDILQDTAQG